MGASWRREDVLRLQGQGFHLFPAGENKLPAGKWRHGKVDYVEVKPSDEQVERWLRRRPAVAGWVILCGGPKNVVVLDVEAAGVQDQSDKGASIRALLEEIPSSARRKSPSGGEHAYFTVTDVPAPSGANGKLVVALRDDLRKAILLAEIRAHGQYAVVLGHGRGDLQEDFAPLPVTSDELSSMLDRLRSVSDVQPRPAVRRVGKARALAEETHGLRPDREPVRADDVPGVIAKALVDGELTWLHVLDQGWQELGVTSEWSLWLRPDYGSAPTSLSSAAGAELLGTPALTVHSSAVPWADPEVGYSPAEVLARSRYDGSFADAMRDVSRTARLAASGRPRPLVHRLSDWPVSVLESVAELLAAKVSMGRPRLDATVAADLQDDLLKLVGVGSMAGVFRRGRELVHVPRMGEEGYRPPPPEEGEDGPAQVHSIDPVKLRFLVDQSFYVYRINNEGDEVHALTPIAPCQGLVSSAELVARARTLRGVVHTPILRVDGSILSDPGYDRPTGLLYLPTVEVVGIPERPSPRQVSEAMSDALDVVAEFPFTSEHDQANYLGAMIIPLLGRLVPPPYPMLLINSPMPGTGKSLLAKILRHLHGGLHRAVLPDNDEEIRKQLTTILGNTTGAVVVWDNITAALKSAQLANLLTTAHWTDRRLGVTGDVSAPNDRLWVATGNNMVVGGDLPRRVVWVNIDADQDQPWKRTGFAIENLAQFVTENQGPILAALLTVIRGWVVNGMRSESPRGDDYGRLISTVRGILRFAGVDGEFAHDSTDRTHVSVVDEDWGNFYRALETLFEDRPFTAGNLVTALDQAGDESLAVEAEFLRSLLPTELADKRQHHRLSAQSLGMHLKNRDRRFVDGRAIEALAPDATNTRRFRIVRAGGRVTSAAIKSRGAAIAAAPELPAGTTGTTGTAHPHPTR